MVHHFLGSQFNGKTEALQAFDEGSIPSDSTKMSDSLKVKLATDNCKTKERYLLGQPMCERRLVQA